MKAKVYGLGGTKVFPFDMALLRDRYGEAYHGHYLAVFPNGVAHRITLEGKYIETCPERISYNPTGLVLVPHLEYWSDPDLEVDEGL